MCRKKLTSAVPVALLLTLSGTIGVANGSNLHVLFDCNGNVLITYGGPKGELPSILAATSRHLHPSALESEIVLGSFDLARWKETPYGNGEVRTEFDTDVDYGYTGIKVYYEVEGISLTYWSGDIPQYFCDEIELAESWSFGGASVSVSFPPRVGVSGSSSTIAWQGHDTSGSAWYLGHVYSGYRAESYLWISSVTQTSDGSHKLGSVWVSACAAGSKTQLVI
ncbi:hypothetical protein JW848_08715 [Candidatus Bipolaricaulota bacterium]|nr:hypothetical protein [Candidatus Bipolaricaulota bacterium]